MGRGAAGRGGASCPRIWRRWIECFQIRRCWRRSSAGRGSAEARRSWPAGADDRDATFVRLMVVKHRTGWGYETLVREVSDSLHLRRFCLIAIGERVPDESTVRKLARRLGAEVVERDHPGGDRQGQRETRFAAAGGADRLDGRGGGHPLPDGRGARAGLARGRWRARAARSRRRSAGTRCGSATARARSADACGR